MADSFVARSRVEVPAGDAFAWHGRPGALERLSPPWERIEVLERTGCIADGGTVVLRVPAGPVKVRWVARHGSFVEGRRFEDDQVSGPFARWHRALAPRPLLRAPRSGRGRPRGPHRIRASARRARGASRRPLRLDPVKPSRGVSTADLARGGATAFADAARRDGASVRQEEREGLEHSLVGREAAPAAFGSARAGGRVAPRRFH